MIWVMECGQLIERSMYKKIIVVRLLKGVLNKGIFEVRNCHSPSSFAISSSRIAASPASIWLALRVAWRTTPAK